MAKSKIYNRIDENPDVKYREQGYTYALKIPQTNSFNFSTAVINPCCLVSADEVKQLGGIRDTFKHIFEEGSKHPSKCKDQSLFINHYRSGMLSRKNRTDFENFSHLVFDMEMDFSIEGTINDKVSLFQPALVAVIDKKNCNFDFLNKPKNMAKSHKSADGQGILQTHAFIASCRDISEMHDLYSRMPWMKDNPAEFFVWSMSYIIQKKAAQFGLENDIPMLGYPSSKKISHELDTIQNLFNPASKDKAYPFASMHSSLTHPVDWFNGVQLASFLRDGKPRFNATKTEKLVPWYIEYQENYEIIHKNQNSSLTNHRRPANNMGIQPLGLSL